MGPKQETVDNTAITNTTWSHEALEILCVIMPPALLP